MRFSKKELKGTGQVFRFTFFSLLKNRANQVTMVILFLIGLFFLPAILLFGGSDVSTQPSGPALGITVYNETDLPVEAEELREHSGVFAASVFQDGEQNAENAIQELSPVEVAAVIAQDGTGTYEVTLYTAKKTEVTAEDTAALEELFQTEVKRAEYEKAGLSDSQIALLTIGYSTEVANAADFAEEAENDGAQYGIQLGYAIVVLMVSILAVSYIIRTVVEEKSSKLVETLLLSVRPLALIAGKILAALAYVFCFLILLLVGFLLSYVISSQIFGLPAPGELVRLGAEQFGLMHMGVGMVAAMLISLLLGCLTFAIIAGISGAGCSSMDDVSGAATVSMLLIMGGYFVSIVVSNLPSGGVALFSALCPVLSVFCGPVQYAVGNISVGILFLSWAVQAVVILLLAGFCAKVYQSLIMYKGTRLTWKAMIGMARTKKGKGSVN